MRKNVHGTALVVGEVGILIRGPAQSGKTSLCLSLLRRAGSIARDAYLIADDRVDLEMTDSGVVMTAPDTIRGLIEIAGIGIMNAKTADAARLALIIDLVAAEDRTRMPEEADRHEQLFGTPIRRIKLQKQDAAFSADVVLTLLASA